MQIYFVISTDENMVYANRFKPLPRNVWNMFKLGESEKNLLKRISERNYTVKNQIKFAFIRNCTLLFTFPENM